MQTAFSYPAGNRERQITIISKCSKKKHEQRKENQPRGVHGKESQTWSQKQEKQRKLWSVVTLILGCVLALPLFNFFRQGHSSSTGSNKLVGKRTNVSKRMLRSGEAGECGESRFVRLAVSTPPWGPGKILFFHVEWKKKRNVHFPSAALGTGDSSRGNQSPVSLRPRSVSKQGFSSPSQDNR